MFNPCARPIHQTVVLNDEMINSSEATPTRTRVRTRMATAALVVTPSPVA